MIFLDFWDTENDMFAESFSPGIKNNRLRHVNHSTNPILQDNWTDAEGYFRLDPFFFRGNCISGSKNISILEYLWVNYLTTDTNPMHLLGKVFSQMLSGVKTNTKKTKMSLLKLSEKMI